MSNNAITAPSSDATDADLSLLAHWPAAVVALGGLLSLAWTLLLVMLLTRLLIG